MDKALVTLVNVICKRGKKIRIGDSIRKEFMAEDIRRQIT